MYDDKEIYPQREMNDDGEIYPNRQAANSQSFGYQSQPQGSFMNDYKTAPQFQNPAPYQQNSAYQQPQYQQQTYQGQVYQQAEPQGRTKFCKHCGGKIPEDAVVCTLCGRQVEELRQAGGAVAPIIINNSNNNVNTNIAGGHGIPKNKWLAFFLCLFLGYFGVHKFYEGRIGMGLLYLFTGGLFGFGWIIDTLILLFKPNPYYIG